MSVASAYRESFERLASEVPQNEREARRRLFDAFSALGLPGRELEDWRYTDLSALSQIGFAPASSSCAPPEHPDLAGVDRVVYVNGHLDCARTTQPALHGGRLDMATADDGIVALNGAFGHEGLALALAANARLTRPLHVVLAGCAGEVPVMCHQQHRIELGEGAEAAVLLDFRGSAGAERLATHRFEIRLGRSAQLRLYRIQDEAAGANLVTRIDATLDRDSRLLAACFDRGAGLARHDFNVTLAAPGAEVGLDGLYAPRARAHVDNHTRIVHACERGRSREHFRGIVDERARAVFNGKIVVQPGAQKTDSEQRVANLLLSPRAEVDAKPELEIYADDVKCAHGATVGQLDARALDYLRSRGLDAATARALLLRAFAAAIVDRVEWRELRERVAGVFGLPADEVAEA